MSSSRYKLGDLVWAKMKGFSPWPARVSIPPPQMKAPKNFSNFQFVYFFGSNNYGLVKEHNMKPYREHKAELLKKNKTAAVKHAVEQIEEYIVNPKKFGKIDNVAEDADEHDTEVEVVNENGVRADMAESPDCYIDEGSGTVAPICNVEVKIERVDIVECETCAECFVDNQEYQKHKLKHDGPNKPRKIYIDHNLEINPKERKLRLKYKRRKATHFEVKLESPAILRNSDNKFMCPVCEKEFTWETHAKIHLRTHTGEKPYACNQCDKRFSQGGALSIHLRRHAGILDYVCTYCKKGFPDNGTLTRHKRTHTGSKPYKCEYCAKQFSDPSSFKCHLRIHTGEKPFVCKLCPRTFGDSSAFIHHKRRHEGRKEIGCAICDKMFYTNYEMKKHVMTVHCAWKPFQCNDCGKRFPVKQSLSHHIKLKHT